MAEHEKYIGNKTNLFETLEYLQANNINPVSREDEIWKRYGDQASILKLDSVGFTRITKEFGIVYFLSRVIEMRNLVLPILKHNGCLSNQMKYDSVFAFFETPAQSLKAAIEANKAIKEAKLMLTEEEPFRICIGIGYGKMLYSETLEGYYGDEMNITSKLGEDIAVGNEILITEAAYASITDKQKELFEKHEAVISQTPATFYRTSI